ncbi:ADP compounds hydrolase NudE [Colwellia sp. Arc7-635]|jgi:ADP-ribose diphosphatase|uniref:ADP compounds hydrolase NudE n=1 Tax=Colwellia sp. Arc7-635 TaxID=2497879 RepID=UPI000F859171|nr:ADP compounds hydrolase NudE [Colwellia sp. Arc7-635]AZQ83066.1 ADP compounds hydrolase NudE [Colwellia sp. Arc7-635]
MTTKKVLPQITARKQVAKSRLFAIEQIDLTFTNGENREYERMSGTGRGAVMIVPMLDADTMLLVREYCAGTHAYELGFPKGLIDAGESAAEAANRELKEEIGYGAEKLTLVHTVAMAPAFFDAQMTIFLAENLYAEKLVGDEPEALEIVPWSLTNYRQLLQEPDFNEARSLAALLLVKDQLGGIS